MASIGYVDRQANGSYRGFLKALSIRKSILLEPSKDKESDNEPGYRLFTEGRDRVKLGAGSERFLGTLDLFQHDDRNRWIACL